MEKVSIILIIALHFVVAISYVSYKWLGMVAVYVAIFFHILTIINHLYPNQQLGLGVVISCFMLGTTIICIRGLQFKISRQLLIVLTALSVFAPLFLPAKIFTPSFSMHTILALLVYIFSASAFFYWLDVIFAERQLRKTPETVMNIPLLDSEKYCFWFVTTAFFLLTLTLISGGIASMIEEKPFIQLTHKNLFALLTWLTFLFLLIGRYFYGWRGRRAIIFFFIGYMFLLLSYVGSTFVLQVILSS